MVDVNFKIRKVKRKLVECRWKEENERWRVKDGNLERVIDRGREREKREIRMRMK